MTTVSVRFSVRKRSIASPCSVVAGTVTGKVSALRLTELAPTGVISPGWATPVSTSTDRVVAPVAPSGSVTVNVTS